MRRQSMMMAVWVLLFMAPSLVTAEPRTTETSTMTQRKGPKAQPSAATDSSKAAGPVLRRSNRMEFDGRLIKGERASGAVYLFQRVPRRLPPLLKLERDELDRIVWPVLRKNADRPVSAPIKPVAKPQAEKKKAVQKPKKRSWKKKKSKWRSKRRWKKWKQKKKAKKKK